MAGNFDLVPEQERSLKEVQAIVHAVLGLHKLEKSHDAGGICDNQKHHAHLASCIWRVSLSSGARVCYLQQKSTHFLKGKSWQATEYGKRLNILPEVLRYFCI